MNCEKGSIATRGSYQGLTRNPDDWPLEMVMACRVVHVPAAGDEVLGAGDVTWSNYPGAGTRRMSGNALRILCLPRRETKRAETGDANGTGAVDNDEGLATHSPELRAREGGSHEVCAGEGRQPVRRR